MILRDVRHTLKRLEAASATQLAADLHMRRSDVEAALDYWIQRGNVRVCQHSRAQACGTTCTRCPIGSMSRSMKGDPRLRPREPVTPAIVYEWVSE